MTRHIVQRQTPVGDLVAFVVAAAAMTVPPVVAAQSAPELTAEDSSGAGANVAAISELRLLDAYNTQLRTEEQE